ncbi:class I SAM-dependent methyltransferase [Octadecabacter sp. R77987]|uniref:class I SAM-dependent methyltransferase n=1 Tax=Octadecabacter sp. R77987 TaxID=3093874 RepID=UPI00366E5E12
MKNEKIDTRAIGLDVSLTFAKWLTGTENLHYGDWTGLEVCAANAGPAQEAYTDRLFKLLPKGKLRILDIGGGAGVTAGKLLALGHHVEIVIPSAFLAARCRENAPNAVIHEMMFEDFNSDSKFDVCLFSESFQYIPLPEGMPKCLTLLEPDGRIIIADCFRSEAFRANPVRATVGSGHGIAGFRQAVADLNLAITHQEDVTAAVAPSVEIEQGLFNIFGHAISRVDEELVAKKPKTRWLINRVLRMFVNERKRTRLQQRLTEQSRNRDSFAANNVYLMMSLAQSRQE